MNIRSTVTDRWYEPTAMVYLVNPVQIAKYLKYGATLYDLIENNGSLVGVFSRKDTTELYEKWKKHELL